MSGPTRADLEAARCYENVDRVPGDPEMTAFKRRARLHQARWREAQGIPIGAQATRNGGSRPLGSRIDLDHAMATGANFITEPARRAAEHRTRNQQPHQTLDERRLWSDLLSSMPMCFNLFGDLHEDRATADRIAHRWWPDLPGAVRAVELEWSPGRRDPEYLDNRTAFDAAVLLDVPGGQGVLGIETKYHEHPKAEEAPPPHRRARYVEVSDRSGAFRPGAVDRILGTKLQQIWLDHLLVLAMLQHETAGWVWGRFVLVHPAGNVGFATLAEEYRQELADDTTFESRTVEELLDTPDALPAATADAFRARYLWH